MESTDILMQANAGLKAPDGWLIFRLSRSKIAAGIVGWALGVILGLGLFIAIASITIPNNYTLGVLAAIITTFILGMVLFIGLGSLWSLFVDARRLAQAEKHMIVITPEDFVKQEGEKIIHVPLNDIRHVTARGARPPKIEAPARQQSVIGQLPSAGENMVGFIAGRRLASSGSKWWNRPRRSPTSLAFVDMRTDTQIIVLNDKAYGDPFLIGAYLKQYAAKVQQINV